MHGILGLTDIGKWTAAIRNVPIPQQPATWKLSWLSNAFPFLDALLQSVEIFADSLQN